MNKVTTWQALRTWISIALITVLRLGPAILITIFRRSRGWILHERWAAAILKRLDIQVYVEKRWEMNASARGVLFVHLNQQTLLSQLFYSVSLPPFPLVVNVEYAALPFVGWMSLALGAVPIIRQRPAQAWRALTQVRNRLALGEFFGISIEGQRTHDGSLSPFKKGPILIALQAQCDIVPFMTHGEYALWPRGTWRIQPGRVDVIVYPAIATQGLGHKDCNRIMTDLRTLAESEIVKYAKREKSEAAPRPFGDNPKPKN